MIRTKSGDTRPQTLRSCIIESVLSHLICGAVRHKLAEPNYVAEENGDTLKMVR